MTAGIQRPRPAAQHRDRAGRRQAASRPGARDAAAQLRKRAPDARQQAYARTHRTRANLLVHGVFVPLFLFGNLVLVLGVVTLNGPLTLLGALSTAVSLAAQGRGHRREPVRPEPFAGPFDFTKRVLREQWLTFPRFVLSGGLQRAWRRSMTRPG